MVDTLSRGGNKRLPSRILVNAVSDGNIPFGYAWAFAYRAKLLMSKAVSVSLSPGITFGWELISSSDLD